MKPIPRKRTAGFTLIEVVLALGVAGFCLTTVIALLPIGLTSNQNAANQTTAVNIAASVLSDLYATPAGGTSPRFQFQLSGANPQTVYFAGNGSTSGYAIQSGSSTVIPTGTSPWTYQAAVWITPPTSPSGSTGNATTARVRVTWPALAANFIGSYETVVKLDGD